VHTNAATFPASSSLAQSIFALALGPASPTLCMMFTPFSIRSVLEPKPRAAARRLPLGFGRSPHGFALVVTPAPRSFVT
jgi:hypothetical protein